MKQILTKAESQAERSGNSIRPDGEVLIAVSSLCLLNHTTLDAADRPALRLGDFEAYVMGLSCSDCLICLALCEEDCIQVPGSLAVAPQSVHEHFGADGNIAIISGAQVSIQVSDSSTKLPWAWEKEVLLFVYSGSPQPSPRAPQVWVRLLASAQTGYGAS